jgi:hypothetical protein
MHATTVAIDLAKKVFQLAVADHSWRVVQTARLTRAQFKSNTYYAARLPALDDCFST